jgi:GDPmannose 4,6-dehydratase
MRDWGYAKDYVKAMWLMLQHDSPEDFVIATGNSISVKEFTIKAFRMVGIELNFTGVGNEEKGMISSINFSSPYLKVGDVVVEVDINYYRPTEVDTLIGDASKAKRLLGWQPEFTVDDLISEMIVSEMNKHK